LAFFSRLREANFVQEVEVELAELQRARVVLARRLELGRKLAEHHH
jgi:hypothetical protein